MASKTAATCSLLILVIILLFATPAEAFGAGFVSRGSQLKGTNFRHGDIAFAIPLLATANRRLVKQIYFGNWLRDFSQLLDRSSLALVPEPVLRALVGVFAFIQFGYATGEFEVTPERLGFYRPEEHVDNPKGYDDGSTAIIGPGAKVQDSESDFHVAARIAEGLRSNVHPVELDVDVRTGMKNYIANAEEAGRHNLTSAEYVERQLVAAIACGRQGDKEAYIHLGAALHTLEDFVAHSNYVELALQMLGTEMQDQANVSPALAKVFTYVGGAAKVKTGRGLSSPITTGTFGALDLYQTLLGEIDDKLSAMSLPGIRTRTAEKGGALQDVAKGLIDLLGGLGSGFEKDILSLQKAATKSQPATWGELDEQPDKLWESLRPVFTLRDNIVKWVYDNLTIRAVQDALAAISTAIDKLVYLVIGIFLGPLLSEFSKILKEQERDLFIQDSKVREAIGEQSIFDGTALTTDPTHSQLAKDHYDSELNEIAGRVAVRISSYSVNQIVELWQPGNSIDPLPTLQSILAVFHHPFNSSPAHIIQHIMYNEVASYATTQLLTNAAAFECKLHNLSAPVVAARIHDHATPSSGIGGNSHVEELTSIHAPRAIAPQTAHDLATIQRPEVQRSFVKRVSDNIERQLQSSNVGDISIKDFPVIKQLLFAPPSSNSPNPLDSGIAKVPGISYLGTFEGISIHEIAAAEGMGETLKDAVVSLILLDEIMGVHEEEQAATRFGWGRSEANREERRRLKGMRGMLELRNTESQREGEEWERRRGLGEKVRSGFEKVKMKVKGKGGEEDDDD